MPRDDIQPHPAGQLILRIGDAIHGDDGTMLGTLDRAVVSPDLHCLTHVGVQPALLWKWPRLVPVAELSAGIGGEAPHQLRPRRAWPDGYPTADVIPGVPENELPDHPMAPTSGLQRFLLSLTSSGADGPLAVNSIMRDRVVDGEAVLHRGVQLVETDRYTIHPLGEIIGVVAEADHHTISAVIVRHRHGFHHRVARLPVSEVERASSRQVTTSTTPHGLDRYDTAL